MNRIDQMFHAAKSSGKTAFIPFLTAGDPTLEISIRCMERVLEICAELQVPAALEIGIPYSDPIADGPTIQESYNRALSRGVAIEAIFQAIGELRRRRNEPFVAMISHSLVDRMGIDRFVQRALAAGIDGALIPDLPCEEMGEARSRALEAGLAWIAMIAPTTPPARRKAIAEVATGFLYYVSVAGITGERDALPAGVLEAVADLKNFAQVPVCVGFGVSRPEHLEQLRGRVDGAIVGSAIVRRVGGFSPAHALPNDPSAFAELEGFLRTLLRPLAAGSGSP